MIVDTSVLIAMIMDEPDASKAYDALSSVSDLKISTGTLVECATVVQAQLGKRGWIRLHQTLVEANVEFVPFSSSQAQIARGAFPKYGKGQNNRAQLNFGDLFAYALARETGETLFFKGADFVHTDLKLLRLDA
ncbi:type II toxin-antitoxin system VapC family toxin [Aquisalinus flavus]|uniref:Ribonuclease VapC n=1 Tax=Aquisalinus flavus TaxID=1526572 RepID=A0A8J2V402_9PROT|nr:type II toxin-antitoxin system VapC family toxin [Aquisalinus flavus]MBD0427449.1 type II toxin-antitoxin system VapC family toxin [Aquisalinus flavus]UNE47250.1 type II toxin-antitoxin system VapC family toxin [Aquisalinus flavus]GGD01103.1 ribonuclease VapC [Aquisalinus flavus]